jgi:hypothetical protein
MARFLHRRRWLLLILAAPFLLFPSPITTPALLIVPGLGIIAWLAGERPFPRTPLNVALLLLSLMALVSTGVTYDMAVSLPKICELQTHCPGVLAVHVGVLDNGNRRCAFWLDRNAVVSQVRLSGKLHRPLRAAHHRVCRG